MNPTQEGRGRALVPVSPNMPHALSIIENLAEAETDNQVM